MIKQKIVDNPPAAYCCMKPDNELLFLGCEAVMLQIRPQVISPPKPTTLSTSPKSCTNVHAHVCAIVFGLKMTQINFNLITLKISNC